MEDISNSLCSLSMGKIDTKSQYLQGLFQKIMLECLSFLKCYFPEKKK